MSTEIDKTKKIDTRLHGKETLRASRSKRRRDREERSRRSNQVRQLFASYPHGLMHYILEPGYHRRSDDMFVQMQSHADVLYEEAVCEYDPRVVRRWSKEQWQGFATLRSAMLRGLSLDAIHRGNKHCFDHTTSRFLRRGDRLHVRLLGDVIHVPS